MTTRQFHLAFNIQLDKENVVGYPSFRPEEIDFWLNKAVSQFVKTRFYGHNQHLTGFQADSKRTSDLRNVTVSVGVNFRESDGPDYYVLYPDNFWFVANTSCDIYSNDRRWKVVNGDPEIKQVDPIQCTFDNFQSRTIDYLGEYRLHRNYARPLMLDEGRRIHLRTDGFYNIKRFNYTYVRRPDYFDFRMPDLEYVYIPDSSHDEIVALAVSLALENISDPRFTTSTALAVGIE